MADIIRTTLGPRSMLKMILDPMGGIVMTNDGNAILREIDVAHPAAKSMIELSRTQDEEVGDGTTSVIILAGELLSVAQPFLERNMHPRVIVSAYIKALDSAIAVMDSACLPLDTNDRNAMMALVRSCLGTKFVSRFGDLICNLALDSVLMVTMDTDVDREDGKGKKKEIDIKRYARIEKLPGGFLEDSVVLDGVMLNKDVVHPAMKQTDREPKDHPARLVSTQQQCACINASHTLLLFVPLRRSHLRSTPLALILSTRAAASSCLVRLRLTVSMSCVLLFRVAVLSNLEYKKAESQTNWS